MDGGKPKEGGKKKEKEGRKENQIIRGGKKRTRRLDRLCELILKPNMLKKKKKEARYDPIYPRQKSHQAA